ncbi:MAG: InlB B-repeat-containing protein [Clostridia bacterium]|nr:InlB B-repeat-containing protein [Clostridia bacterium]
MNKIFAIIGSILCLAVVGFCICWTVINFDNVKSGLSGTALYTEEQLQDAVDKTYNDAFKEKAEYEVLMNEYRDTITSQTDQISKYKSDIKTLLNTNKDYSLKITQLESDKTSLTKQVSLLTTQNEENQVLISENKKLILSLQNEVAENEEDIANKEKQISNLQTVNSQLQKTNDLNAQTIVVLNNQIVSLNTQISDMSKQLQNNSSDIVALNNKISELEKSVKYYESYISNLENENEVVATFEFDNSVYNIQILSKGSYASVVNPTSTDKVIFNYWEKDGVQVDLSTTQINENTKFVANITYKYEVKFKVDNDIIETQLVVKNGYVIPNIEPIKDGYVFDGYTLNGVDIIDLTTTPITADTLFVAKFTKLHNVSFIKGNETISTQSVRNGNYALEVNIENTDYETFNGWLLNGAKVEILNYTITADTVFVADITYSYDAIFMVENEVYNSQIIQENNFVVKPTDPIKDGYTFTGWYVNDILTEVETTPIIQNITFVAKFELLHNVNFYTYYSEKTTLIETQKVSNNGSVNNLNPPEISGYEFVGWSIDKESVIDLTTLIITSDLDIYALYKPASFTWTYDDSNKLHTTTSTSTGTALTTYGPAVQENIYSSIVVDIDSLQVQNYKYEGVQVGSNKSYNDPTVSIQSSTTDLVFVFDSELNKYVCNIEFMSYSIIHSNGLFGCKISFSKAYLEFIDGKTVISFDGVITESSNKVFAMISLLMCEATVYKVSINSIEYIV